MSAFFIPGLAGDRRALESAYVEMQDGVERDFGRRPSAQRIQRLWTRRGNLDCITEVGSPDPIHGGTVIAIFDLGWHRPFVVLRCSDEQAICEVLGCSAYSVSEFEA